MKFSVQTAVLAELTPRQIVEKLCAHGYPAVEWRVHPDYHIHPRQLVARSRHSRSSGIPWSACFLHVSAKLRRPVGAKPSLSSRAVSVDTSTARPSSVEPECEQTSTMRSLVTHSAELCESVSTRHTVQVSMP
jgi:hypothetical protein